jgi:UDP-N-acetylglucosamine--N-acetylmuramyl-(pentapeptide) pyrophosphoryl-undecaprenol N-acetylglucosamine transferase
MNILIAGGGTGGHLFPGIALAQELRRRHPTARIVFVGTARGIEVRAVPKAGFELKLIAVSGLRNMQLQRLLKGLVKLPWSLVQALRIVQSLKPQVAVSVGGYAAGPAMVAARLLGVRCIVMEQNAIAGITTRLLAQLATRVIAAMPCPQLPPDKTAVLGNPVRQDLLPIRAAPYSPRVPLRLLVLGGSQGARVLNDAMLQLLPLLQAAPTSQQPLLRLHIVHQTGLADAARVAAAYAQSGLPNAGAVAFIDDMATAYAQADLLLCRAGATTLAEVTVCGRPSLLVPFAAAAGDHQSHNAAVLVRKRAAQLLPQETLTGAGLYKILSQLSQSPSKLASMAQAAHALGRPQAVQDIADVVLREVARA